MEYVRIYRALGVRSQLLSFGFGTAFGCECRPYKLSSSCCLDTHTRTNPAMGGACLLVAAATADCHLDWGIVSAQGTAGFICGSGTAPDCNFTLWAWADLSSYPPTPSTRNDDAKRPSQIYAKLCKQMVWLSDWEPTTRLRSCSRFPAEVGHTAQ